MSRFVTYIHTDVNIVLEFCAQNSQIHLFFSNKQLISSFRFSPLPTTVPIGGGMEDAGQPLSSKVAFVKNPLNLK